MTPHSPSSETVSFRKWSNNLDHFFGSVFGFPADPDPRSRNHTDPDRTRPPNGNRMFTFENFLYISNIARKIQKHFWLVTTCISGLFNPICQVQCNRYRARIQESKINAVWCGCGSKILNLWCRSRVGCWRQRPCTSPGLRPLSLTTSSLRPSFKGTASHPGIYRSLNQRCAYLPSFRAALIW